MITFSRNVVFVVIMILLIGVITIPSKISIDNLEFFEIIERGKSSQINIEIQEKSINQIANKIATNDLLKEMN